MTNGNLIQLKHADCRKAMQDMDAASVDSIVTDPPYGLSFMGKAWDHGVPGQVFWDAALRVAKPGAHLLAFGGTRTYHRLVCAIEDAGWEIRDTIAWVHAMGFPKSLDVSKAIDKAAGVEREVGKPGRYASRRPRDEVPSVNAYQGVGDASTALVTAPATPEAEQWDGWGTALKPALEPICVARKPFSGTVAENVLEHGTGALNVDGCRVEGVKGVPASVSNAGQHGWGTGGDMERKQQQNGRWPANLIHDGSDEVVRLFPHTKSGEVNPQPGEMKHDVYNAGFKQNSVNHFPASEGSAARFFYCAKATKADRGSFNDHPTVKPTDLMRYLCRLVTPPGGLVLDPFMGSGSTGKAAVQEGFRFVGIEKDAHSIDIARRRIFGQTIGLQL